VANNFQDERRQSPRVNRNIPLKISSDDGDVVTQSWNLSRSGVYCRVNRYIDPMTKLKIHLLLPLRKNQKVTTKKLSCRGVVVRSESVPGTPEYNVAIFFNEINNKDADNISTYITAELAKVS